MARAVLLANDGTDRLVIRTICTHLIFFHEAGYEFRTERKQGWRWLATAEAEQPRDLECRFNEGIDPDAFGATPQEGEGVFKLTCEVLSIRRHCVFVAVGDPESDPIERPREGLDPRSVKDVIVRFTYAGQPHTLQHRP